MVTGRGCDLAGLGTDDTCDFTCMNNYVINGATSVTCTSGGTFTPSLPTCDGKIRDVIAFSDISAVLSTPVTY